MSESKQRKFRRPHGSMEDECLLFAEKIMLAQRFDNRHGYDAHAATELGALIYQRFKEMQKGVQYVKYV